MGNTIRHPRANGATHNCTKVMELVEDARPCVHIFVNNFLLAVAVTLIVSGILGIVRPTHH